MPVVDLTSGLPLAPFSGLAVANGSAAPPGRDPARWPPPVRRLYVDRLVAGATRVWWGLDPAFCAARGGLAGLSFVLQRAESPSAGAWADVAEAADAPELADRSRHGPWPRHAGPYYRVVVRDPAAGLSWASRAAHGRGDLADPHWALARELLRKEHLRLAQTPAGLVAGWLLKRRIRGQAPPAAPDPSGAVDPLTGGLVNPLDPATFGVPVDGGYWPPIPCRADLGTGAPAAPERDEHRGVHDPGHLFEARVPGDVPVDPHDVFVADRTDARYVARSVSSEALIGDVAIVWKVGLRLLPESDPAHAFPVPDRWPQDEGAADECRPVAVPAL